MKKIKGISVFTTNVKQLTVFYTKLFDLQSIEKSEESVLFNLNGIHFLIHEKTGATKYDSPGEDHIELSVDNAVDAVEDLEQKGVKVDYLAKKYYWGTSAYLKDPDGRIIELSK